LTLTDYNNIKLTENPDNPY